MCPPRGEWRRGRAVPSLIELGMTELEATIYCFLLESGPTTGYQVAKEIGKPVANAYKALYSMEEKGAVLVEEGETRRCRAVAPKELLSRLDREFKSRRKSASDALARVDLKPEDDGSYRLTSASQVIERALTMAKRAKTHLVVDAFPGPLETLRPHIERAARRGVQTLVECYEDTDVEGAKVVLHPSRDLILPNWPGEILTVAVDAKECLQALLERGTDRVVHAVWTANLHLACHAYIAGVNNVALSELMSAIEDGVVTPKLARKVAEYDVFRLRHTPGFNRLADEAAARQIDETLS